jgi:hypothetical protein
MGGDLLAYEPYTPPLEYHMSIKSHAVIGSDCACSTGGVVVAASITHPANEPLSKDGQIMRFLNPEEMVFLYSDDHKSIPLP